jgi:hypothetical protein
MDGSGMQQARKPALMEPVEAVQHREDGTCAACGSVVPKVEASCPGWE